MRQKKALEIATKASASAAKNLRLKYALFGEAKVADPGVEAKPGEIPHEGFEAVKKHQFASEEDIRKNAELLEKIGSGW